MNRLTLLVVIAVMLFGSTEVKASGDISNFRLPFNGDDFVISQGPRCPSPNSHNDSVVTSNKEAIDFVMSVDTPIFAAESGMAYYTFDDAPEPDNPKSYGGGNMIFIVHDNGLKSIYAHLNYPTKDTGGYPKWVEKDEQIGLSGNKVHVGAHLHFAVVEYNADDNPYSLNGTPVPIWQMPGITWDPKYDDLSYPASGICLPDGLNDGTGTWPPVEPPGTKSLELEKFTLDRTNPKVGETTMFEAELKNTGEVPITLDTVFVRLVRAGEPEVLVHAQDMGSVTIARGEIHAFNLRGPPITVNGLWKIHKVEAHDIYSTWFVMRDINDQIMIGFPSLAKDHPVAVSSVRNGNVGQFAVDGDHRTRWESSLNDNQTLEIDLQQVRTIDSIIVRSDWAYPKWFKVEYSTGGGWTELVDDVAGHQDNSSFIPLGDTQVSKLKFTFKERGTEWAHAIWEIEVYDQVDGCPALARCGSPATSTPVPTTVNTPTPIPPPNATNTPVHTPTPQPTTDTTPPEGYVTSPVDGAFLGTGWFNATAYATDFGTGVKVVEFHFWHNGAWHIVEDRNGDDGWSASFDLTGLWAQIDMKMLLHLEDKAGNRIQSSVVSGLTNVPASTPTPVPTATPTPSVTDPMSGVISGTLVDENGTPVRGVDVQLWRDTQPDVIYWSQWIENGTYRFYGLPYSTWTVVVFNPTDNEYWKPVDPQIVKIDAQHLVHEVNFALVPTNTATPVPTSTPMRTPVPTMTPTSTLVATGTLVPTATVTPTSTPSPTSTPTKTLVPTSTPTVSPTPTEVWTNTATPVPVPTLTATPMPTTTPTPTPSVTDPMSGVIEGSIVDENGTSVRGVDVQLWRDTQTSAFWIVWVEDGTYRFDGLPYSTWTLHVEEVSSNDLWETVEPQVVVINKSQKEQTVNFVLTRKQIPVFKVSRLVQISATRIKFSTMSVFPQAHQTV